MFFASVLAGSQPTTPVPNKRPSCPQDWQQQLEEVRQALSQVSPNDEVISDEKCNALVAGLEKLQQEIIPNLLSALKLRASSQVKEGGSVVKSDAESNPFSGNSGSSDNSSNDVTQQSANLAISIATQMAGLG